MNKTLAVRIQCAVLGAYCEGADLGFWPANAPRWAVSIHLHELCLKARIALGNRAVWRAAMRLPSLTPAQRTATLLAVIRQHRPLLAPHLNDMPNVVALHSVLLKMTLKALNLHHGVEFCLQVLGNMGQYNYWQPGERFPRSLLALPIHEDRLANRPSR